MIGYSLDAYGLLVWRVFPGDKCKRKAIKPLIGKSDSPTAFGRSISQKGPITNGRIPSILHAII